MDKKELELLEGEIAKALGEGDPKEVQSVLSSLLNNMELQVKNAQQFIDSLKLSSFDAQAATATSKLLADRIETFQAGLDTILQTLKDSRVVVPDKMEVTVKNWSEQSTEVTVKNLDQIKIPEPAKVVIPDKIRVENLDEIKIPEPKSEVRVTNLKDIPATIVNVPEIVTVKEPSWYQPFSFSKLKLNIMSVLDDFFSKREVKVDLDRYRDAHRPLSVRLSDGKHFYQAIMSAVSSAIGVPFKTGSGTFMEALVDNDGHLQVDVLSTQEQTPIGGNNPSTELGYNAAGQLVRIRKTEDGVTKTKLITGDSIADTVVATTKTYSAWS